MRSTAYYKRLVLDLYQAVRDGDTVVFNRLMAPDFRTARGLSPSADLEILGLVGEGSTVVLRTRRSGTEQVQFFEGRDSHLVPQQWFQSR